jgi:hypothetical protein
MQAASAVVCLPYEGSLLSDLGGAHRNYNYIPVFLNAAREHISEHALIGILLSPH